MPGERTFADAFEYARRFVKNMPLEDVRLPIVQHVIDHIWHYRPWRFTLGLAFDISLIGNQSEYTVSLPPDFAYLWRSYLINPEKDMPSDLNIEPFIPQDPGKIGLPVSVSAIITDTSSLVRFSPRPPASLPSGIRAIGIYKKRRFELVEASLFNDIDAYSPTGRWPITFFHVIREGILWQAYLFADDPRAGSAQASSDGKIAYSGQRAVFEAALQQMASQEPMPLDWGRMAPEIKGVK